MTTVADTRRTILPDLGERTHVMGILNVTPDSFSDGGDFVDRKAAVAHALEMEQDGADIIDIGGESTRPGHEPISSEEEQSRVLPVIRQLASQLSVPISIDTYKASTAWLALKAGAKIVNDVWGFQREPAIASIAAEFGATVVMMHNRTEIDPTLDIIDELRTFFDRSIEIARKAGIPDEKIILDPGIGFGKTFEQQLAALHRLGEVKAFGFPVLVGVSRKSLLGRLHDRSVAPRDRLFGTIASHVMAISSGADIVRVHDVTPHMEAIRVADAIRKGRRP